MAENDRCSADEMEDFFPRLDSRAVNVILVQVMNACLSALLACRHVYCSGMEEVDVVSIQR